MFCYSAILVFESLNAAERCELCQFMRANRFITLDTAVRALYEVLVVDGEDVIVRCEPPLPATQQDAEVLPF